jgi:uncharacterized protein YaaN involved in tellurite resistance
MKYQAIRREINEMAISVSNGETRKREAWRICRRRKWLNGEISAGEMKKKNVENGVKIIENGIG